jgi:hypothetical protein
LLPLAFSSCSPDKKYHSSKVIVDHELYLIEYKQNWGVQGGEVKYYYITDSSSFREYVGSADEEEHVKVRISGDTLTVDTYSWSDATGTRAGLIDSDRYSLSDLKESGSFDE